MSKASVLQQLSRDLLEFIFPPRCAVCDRLGRKVICDGCCEQFEFIAPPYCQRCGQALPPEMGTGSFICGHCRQKPPRFDGARSVGLHHGPLRRAVLRFKFARRRELLEPLVGLLAERVEAEIASPAGLPWASLTGIVPVVLHPRRSRWRGFDQAVLLSQRLSTVVGMPCLGHTLVRQKDTKPQVELTPSQRRENMRGAFALAAGADVTGGSFLLIDDVYTTGSTLNAAASVLAKAGAEAMYGLTVTRALPQWHLQAPQLRGGLGDEDDSPDNV